MNQELNGAMANAGCLLFFSAGCTPRERSDALDITLYTQLAASKKFPRATATRRWSNTQLEAMARFGWGLTQRKASSLPGSDLATGNLWDWLQGALPPFMPAAEIAQAQAFALRCYRRNPDQTAIHSYAGQVLTAVPVHQTGDPGQQAQTPGSRAVLQLGFVAPGMKLALVSVSFIYRRALPATFLEQPLSAQDVLGNVELAFSVLSPLEVSWSQFRQQIRGALEARRAELAYPLDGDEQCHEPARPSLRDDLAAPAPKGIIVL